MKTIKSNSLKVVLFLLFSLSPLLLEAQDSTKTRSLSTYQHLDLSYILGAQLYNDNFLYNPGLSTQVSFGVKVTKDVGLGIGAGYTSLTKERFIPIYFEAYGQKKKKKNAPFIKFQAGYSIGWNSSTSANSNYDMKGGAYFNAGLGRKIELSKDYALLFNWSYSHQFARMEYEVFEGKVYSEPVNYDMIWIALGLLLNN